MRRPLGLEFLSGPPIGSMEYFALPPSQRHGYLKAIVQELKEFDPNRTNGTSPDKIKRQFGHAA